MQAKDGSMALRGTLELNLPNRSISKDTVPHPSLGGHAGRIGHSGGHCAEPCMCLKRDPIHEASHELEKEESSMWDKRVS